MTVLHDLYKELDGKRQLLLEVRKLIMAEPDKRNYYVQQEYSIIQDRNKLERLIKYIEKVESFDLIKLVLILANVVQTGKQGNSEYNQLQYVIQEIEQYLNTGKEVT